MMKIVVAFIFAGAVVTLVFMAQQGDGLETISKYYMNAKELTGGKNIVNAILGDFRALDTMFEGLSINYCWFRYLYIIKLQKIGGVKMKENDVVLKQ